MLADENPALDIQPEFSSPTFEALRNCIIGGTQTTHEEVATELANVWKQDHNLRETAWTRQVEEETHLVADAAHAELEQLEQECLHLERETKAELQEAEKKKPKINDFKSRTIVGDTLTPCPSQYAIQKLKSFEFVELYYFSPDGCKKAADEAKTSSDDTFGLTRVDDFIALKPVASCKPSCKVIQDHSLDWQQFDLAKNSFLLHINKLSWPEKHQWALTMFFMNIITHPSRNEPLGEKSLLLYAA
ncbi:hypothetical protein K503DRAFT_806118 [Rhizopogon vinicolor AM-OR11-026]|uniref:Uncharacterized protein n=1 Tax=Rhizopogon vinicolor AM-OR11-026 TaxID=1314800 RepID=A0A1B7MFK2_9AGAM|nr:hypothetical protein K503DRAFT_806118 [Rhizopogon vinicolor AM-OR11-026]